jgi:uncharacterized membrane protein YgaE (UPF0421/DUF939 family)
MKPETNCFDCCMTQSVLSCISKIALWAAVIILVWIMLKYITEWIKMYKESKKEEVLRSEKFKKECQSKILEFMEKEMNSCDKIYKVYKGVEQEKKDLEELAKKAKENIERIRPDNPYVINDDLIKELKSSIENLDKSIKGKDLEKLETAVNGLKDSLNNEKKCFVNSTTYLKVLNRFLNENNDLKDIF